MDAVGVEGGLIDDFWRWMLITDPSGPVEEPDARLTRPFHRGNRLFGVETADVASITNSRRPLLQ